MGSVSACAPEIVLARLSASGWNNGGRVQLYCMCAYSLEGCVALKPELACHFGHEKTWFCHWAAKDSFWLWVILSILGNFRGAGRWVLLPEDRARLAVSSLSVIMLSYAFFIWLLFNIYVAVRNRHKFYMRCKVVSFRVAVSLLSLKMAGLAFFSLYAKLTGCMLDLHIDCADLKVVSILLSDCQQETKQNIKLFKENVSTKTKLFRIY